MVLQILTVFVTRILTAPKRYDDHPRHFYVESPSPRGSVSFQERHPPLLQGHCHWLTSSSELGVIYISAWLFPYLSVNSNWLVWRRFQFRTSSKDLPFGAAVRKLHLTLAVCNMNLDVCSQLLLTDLETLLTASSADEPKIIGYQSNRSNSAKVSLLIHGKHVTACWVLTCFKLILFPENSDRSWMFRDLVLVAPLCRVYTNIVDHNTRINIPVVKVPQNGHF